MRQPRSSWAAGLVVGLSFGLIAGSAAAQIGWRGRISTGVGVRLDTCQGDHGCELLDYNNRNVLGLDLTAPLGDGGGARAELAVHNLNRPNIKEAQDAGESARVVPLSLRLRQAWIEGFGVLVDDLDVRVGAQTVRWGTADGYSPSDRLNPIDLEDPTTFEERLALPGVHLAYHWGEVTLTGTWFPVFTPALLAADMFDLSGAESAYGSVDLDAAMADGTAPTVRDVGTRVRSPPTTLAEGAVGLRASWAASFGDLAVGWYRGRDAIPQVSGEVIPENLYRTNEVDVLVTLRYPRLQMVSADLRAPLWDEMTGWIDAALILPTRTTAYITASRLADLERLGVVEGAPDHDVVGEVQSSDPYLSAAVGVDATLWSKLYVNVQYLRGFVMERSADDLHHYALLTLRYPADDAPLQLELRNALEARPTFDGLGWMTHARLTLLHADRVRFGLLAALQDGADHTTMGLFHALSEVRLEVSAAF